MHSGTHSLPHHFHVFFSKPFALSVLILFCSFHASLISSYHYSLHTLSSAFSHKPYLSHSILCTFSTNLSFRF
ncbi:hypothetical protein E2C01_034491 [Portunus trituberculatus]|uniref:Uncharacterized protein n=1 Tax=Portunus trituberculatus TaxID=210409 RepID=A0A5B7F5X5_PORTR|nr:hypothetical protein [Portunus trituberculatus]